MKTKLSSKQAAAVTGLSIHTLRYYEQVGLIDGIERDKNGYRQYSESNITWFQIISYSRAMGIPIGEMLQFFTLNNSEDSTVRREFLEAYRVKVTDQIKELEKAVEKIDYKIDYFKSLEALEKGQ
jgi:DNA-binding transcriptional MerR regulator